MNPPTLPDSRAPLLTPAPPERASSLKRLRALAATIPPAADLILLGDSLAAGWPVADLPATGAALNLGLPGDRIQNTLWRLQAIDTAHLRPRLTILLLGTNNLGDGDAPEVIVNGLQAVAEAAIELWRSPLLLLTIPQRGEPPGFREAARRAINDSIRRFSGQPTIDVLDIDATLSPHPSDPAPSLEPDLLHLSAAGYRRLGRALAAYLAERRLSGPASAARADSP